MISRHVGLPAFASTATVLALTLLTIEPAFGQSVDQNLWGTNGYVRAVVEAGGTIYIGGNFTRVGPSTGGAVPLDSTSGQPVWLPKVAGTVRAFAVDGLGGWFVGGSFTHVGGLPRSNLAHILSDHTVSPWNPGANGIVYALASSGGTVYAGGNFTIIGGQARNRIGAVDATTGIATSWDPDANNSVFTLAVDGGKVYAGGGFTSIGGQPRNRIAALNVTSGAATVWNPNASNTVLALAVSGGVVYTGGLFFNIGGQSRNYIAALDTATGLATNWNPSASRTVWALVVSGGTVYAGGEFSVIGGQGRNSIAALDAASGVPTSWNPNANNPVYALAVSGATVYAGGSFTSIGGQVRNNVAALGATSALATTWDPSANSTVYALTVIAGTIHAGGDFTSMGGQTRNNIAALDATSGIATAWNPNANSTVYALAMSGGTIYVGGQFTSIGGQTRNRIAALSAATGLAVAWNPNASGPINIVEALVVSGGTVYAGGGFTTIGGQTRNRIAALDASTGFATTWNPNANGIVDVLAVGGGTVYAGGNFGTIGGQGRNRIAALDSASGLATSWNPNANGAVLAIAVNGATVYTGGAFTAIGGQTRNYIAALDRSSGLATAWNPNVTIFEVGVYAVAVGGRTVYAGGDFTAIGGQTRNAIAALDAENGLPIAWDPGQNGQVSALVVSGRRVYAGGAFTSVGGLPHTSIVAIASVPEILAVQPASGGNDAVVTATVSGLNLQSGATVKLSRAAQPDVPGTDVAVAANGLTLTAAFDLQSVATGPCDVIVTNPDLQSATLPGGFTVAPGAPQQLRVTVLSPLLMRPNRRKAFDIVLENLGNTDVLDVPLWISRIPAVATIEPDFSLAPPPQAGGEPDWTQAPLTFDGPSGKYMALLIPRIAPGTSVRRIYLTVPSSVTSFELDAAFTPPWVDGRVFRECLTGGGVITATSCVGSQIAAIKAYLAATPAIETLSGIGLWAKIAWQCEGASTLPAALSKAEQVLDFMLQPVQGGTPPSGCEVALAPRWQDRRLVTIVTSVDPNDKLGMGGVGAGRLIGSEQILPYSVRFENADTASAAAQDVVVIDPLDRASLDVNTVSLGRITFGNRSIEPPPGLTSYTSDVDLRPEKNLIVRIGVNLDRATGVMAWSLRSIDPATGQSPVDPLVGFLPPNVAPPEGEGSLLFTVMPKPGLGSGSAIRNRATINFDGDEHETPEWSNTLDTTPPESHVLPLGANQDSASFTVRWEAIGSAPDLKDFSVYVSQNGSPFRPWRVETRATGDTIEAPSGNYAFYSLARDSSGNLEEVPTSPDVQTFSRVSVDEIGGVQLALEGALPNPVLDRALVWFTLPSRERAVLEVMDVAGRRLLKREVGTFGAGRHSVDVSAAVRRPGLYFIRLTRNDRTLRARMAVVR